MNEQEQIMQTIQQLEQQLAQLKKSANATQPTENASVHSPAPASQQTVPDSEIQDTAQVREVSDSNVVTENVVVGKEGAFDGVFMISDDDKKYQVPPNYVSKSQLVIGDRLKIMEIDETGSRYSFKQLAHISRRDLEGILTKKDNQWAVHTTEGTYYVVAAAVKFFGGEIGDKAVITLPAEDVRFPVVWAALKELIKQEEKTGLFKQTPPAQPKYYAKQVTPPATTTDIMAKVPVRPVVQPAPLNDGGSQQSTVQPTIEAVPTTQPQFDQPKPVVQQHTPQPAPHQPASSAVTEGEVRMSGDGDEVVTSGEVDLTITEEQRWELR